MGLRDLYPAVAILPIMDEDVQPETTFQVQGARVCQEMLDKRVKQCFQKTTIPFFPAFTAIRQDKPLSIWQILPQ